MAIPLLPEGRASLRTGDQHDATERVSTGPVRHRDK